ncbi:DUF4062 domain-containing protein [Paenibacillus hexagrammi]|uniref:DUF4062 domain-containing protein n=1 Tax=Paenibacillus hexagrammi TaxID=2908839 RepID=A0ABY3SNV5_9BACL|nr:DUF4062 domain-containing protein [Paenibacillus sp. YPD9-1]UJF35507.1 DUF4062 domain-containing protein [Paenibacillus sp. YPD9-1]
MPSPRVFISSTCYDLGMARDQLRSFLLELGYEPVLSEYSDVLFDPRTHTHTSCLQEVPNTDMIILIVGSRFGGKIIPDALTSIDIETLMKSSFNIESLENIENLSITQIEVLKAIETSVPVFAFIEEKVLHDHLVYEKNKDLIGKINFPSIEKADTAKYIFEFINFLRHRIKGNSVISFSKIEDIENHLRKQWASLFQRLLREQREKDFETRRMISLSDQLEDLKTAIFSTIGNSQTKDIARGVIKYRKLIDLLLGLHIPDKSIFVQGNCSFDDLLHMANIVEIKDIETSRPYGRAALIKEDGTFYESRFSSNFILDIRLEWDSFITMSPESRQVIFETVSDDRRIGPPLLRYRNETIDQYFNERNIEAKQSDEIFVVTSTESA